MPNIVSNIPNFVSGVSQQPRTMRFPSQAEESINAFPSVVEGLTKRPPSQHIKRLYTTGLAQNHDTAHFIDRSETERYVTEIRNGTIRVWDLDGNEKTVYYGGATPSTSPTAQASTFLTGGDTDFKMLTIADYTFVLNKTIAPQFTSDKVLHVLAGSSKNRLQKVALFTIKQMADLSEFTIRIDCKVPGTSQARSILYRVTTGIATDTTAGWNVQYQAFRSDNFLGYSLIRQERIKFTSSLVNNTTTLAQTLSAFIANGTTGATLESSSGTITTLATMTGYSGWLSFYSSSVLYFTNDSVYGSTNPNSYDTNGDLIWGASASDSAGGAILNLNFGDVQAFSDLPRHALHNTIYKIVGYPQDTGDEYWVKFNAWQNAISGSLQSEGEWKETIAPGEYYKINPVTMPWALIRLSTGNFAFTPLDGVSRTYGSVTFVPPKWADKMCGDSETNKDPSFLNPNGVTTKKINDIFFYKNRLGFLSEENVIFSESGEYFNFFRTTITQTLDADRIDIASSSVNVTNLNYAIPFFDRLLLFAENSQFSLIGSDNLTAKSASIQISTSYSAIPDVPPVGVGKFVYFPFFKNNYSGVREYFLNPENAFMEANDISVNIPKYIEGKIRVMSASDTESILAVLSRTNKNILYIYKYLNIGSERVQGAWSKFAFSTSDNILFVFFKKEIMYILVQRDDGVYLEKIDFQAFQEKQYLPYVPRMDRLVAVYSTGAGAESNLSGITTSFSNSQTTITLPLSFGNAKPLAVAGFSPESDLSLKLTGVEPSYAYSSNSSDFYRNNLPNNFTIFGFFKPENLNNQVIFILDKGALENWKAVQLNISNQSLNAMWKTEDNFGVQISVSGVVLGEWNRFIIAYNSTTNQISLRLNNTTSTISTSSVSYLDIAPIAENNFVGSLDNLGIIKDYVNPTTLDVWLDQTANGANLYSVISKSLSTLLSFFTFNSNDGDVLTDVHSKVVVFDKIKGKYLNSSQSTTPNVIFDEIKIVSHTIVSGQSTIVVEGSLNSYNGPIYFGVPYTMFHTITPVSLRAPGQKGGQILVSSGNLQLKYAYLAYTNSKSFSVVVSSNDPAQGNNYTYRYLSSKGLQTGIFRFPIFCKTENAFISFINSTIYPSCFSSADFEGTLTNSFQRA
jgi:hypothetical protein